MPAAAPAAAMPSLPGGASKSQPPAAPAAAAPATAGPPRRPEVAGAQTLRRGLMVLRLLTRVGPGGLRMGDICRQVALSKATAVRLTQALVDEGFVVKDPASGRYRLGPEAFAVGLAAEPSYELQRLAAPTLRTLAAETEDTVFFSVLHGYETICLSRDEGDFPIRNQLLKPGDRVPLGVGAGGCALLAAFGDAEVAEVLAHTRAARTLRYPRCTDAALWQMIRETRERGWCVLPGLLLPDSWAVAAIVRDPHGQPVAAITVAAIRSRLGPARRAAIGERLLQASAEITRLAQAKAAARAG
jgi:DNA-binding IclR family transcriptional regulator